MELKELPKINYEQYIGTKTEIGNAEIIETKYGLALKISSKPLDDENKVIASSLFSIAHNEDGYFIAVDGKLHKFLIKKKLDASMLPDDIEKGMTIPVLNNVAVVVQMKSESGFLEIV